MAKDRKTKHGEDAARAETIEKLKNLKAAAAGENTKSGEEKEAAGTEEKEKGAAAKTEETKAVTEEKEEKETAETKAEEPAAEKDAEEKTEEADGEKKGLFGKKDKEKEKLKEQVAELNDKVVRQMAEFENFRKRTEKEKDAMFETGAKSVLEKLLPVVDNFERGIAVLSEEESATPFAEGIQKVYRQLMDELTKLEVKPIEAVGQEFDPNLHNAVMHVDDESLGDNVVVEELQKGYTYRESVIRHSMVKVAN